MDGVLDARRPAVSLNARLNGRKASVRSVMSIVRRGFAPRPRQASAFKPLRSTRSSNFRDVLRGFFSPCSHCATVDLVTFR